MENNSCFTCVYEIKKLCRRMPPQIVVNPHTLKRESHFPVVGVASKCGEYTRDIDKVIGLKK